MTWNSGPSRKRPVVIASADTKFPQVWVPYDKFNAPLTVPNVPYEVVTPPCAGLTPRPERVVTTTTMLVLSPYSAEGAPSITSIDCTEATGSWFEKALLC